MEKLVETRQNLKKTKFYIKILVGLEKKNGLTGKNAAKLTS